MNWISTRFSRHWRSIHFAAVVILSAGLIFSPAAVNRVISETILSGLYYPFFKLRSAVELLLEEAAANDRLRGQLMDASLKLSFHEEAVRENQRLRQALGFESPPGYQYMPAEVVSVSGHEKPVAAVINRGLVDSVVLNQPVVNQDGLIGRVASTTLEYATVQLLTDPANRVSARVASSREMGIARYTLSEGLILDNFPLQGTVAVGDTILSSGLGGVYPPGIKVGYVTAVERDEEKPFCRVKLMAAVNFRAIEELFVLKVEPN